MYKKKQYSISIFIFVSVIILVLLRLVLIGAIPLLDKTEARYAEIARLMVETKEWVVLQVDYGFPFWAKPPLSTWLSAFSFKMFGISELTARLPSFLMNIILLIILGFKAKNNGLSKFLPAFILLTTPEFLIHTGVVSTDTTLAFCLVVAMLSFWEALQEEANAFWKYLFFIAIGLGLLAKGPIILIFIGPPILIWILLHKISLRRLLKKLRWQLGILITLFIAIPWYALAELKSSGFLDYFILGEHFKRFFDPKWTGDLYGAPHRQPFGMIWLFLLIFAFPWVQLVLFKFWKERKTILKNEWVSFLALWLLWIPLFFTFSRSIIHTYILPSMLPMALLVMYWWKDLKPKRIWLALGTVFPVIIMLGTIVFLTNDKTHKYLNSDKYLLSNSVVTISDKQLPIVYWKRKSYSGQFYSQTKVKLIKNDIALDSVLRDHGKLFIIVLNKMREEFPLKYASNLQLIDSNYKTSIFLLNQESSLSKYHLKESINAN